MADIGPTLFYQSRIVAWRTTTAPRIRQALEIPRSGRKPDVNHPRKADDVGARPEVAERGFHHAWTLNGRQFQPKPIWSNNIASRMAPAVSTFAYSGVQPRHPDFHCGWKKQLKVRRPDFKILGVTLKQGIICGFAIMPHLTGYQ